MINIMWRAYLSRSALKAHERWARGGREREGRLVLSGCDLRDANLPYPHLVAARFVRCDLTGANFRIGNLSHIELVECIWNNGRLEMVTFNEALIEDGQFRKAYLNVATFIGAQITGGEWNQADLHHTTWNEAVVRQVCFQNARFQGATIKGARFIGCDFRGANLAEAHIEDTVFEDCDLRETNLQAAKIKGSVFPQGCFAMSCRKPERSDSFSRAREQWNGLLVHEIDDEMGPEPMK